MSAGSRLFRDARRSYTDDLVRVELEQARGGHVPPGVLKEAQDALWRRLQPVLDEVPDKPLSVEATKEIVSGMQRGKSSDSRVAELVELVTNTRTAVYETVSAKRQELTDLNQALPKERPLLNALLKSTGAGNSVPLARELLAEQEASESPRPSRSILGP